MIIDALYDNVKSKGPVCVGLDTDIAYLPESLVTKSKNVFSALFSFNKEIIDSTKDVSSVYKVQVAYYEALGIEGMKVYKDTLKYLKDQGCLVIADVKRGDIAKTAEMYAKAHFSGDFEADFMTISPYMGVDTIDPYLGFVANHDKGLFVLVRTSNPGANDFEYLKTENSRLYEVVAKKVQEVGLNYLGKCNYSSIGAVMGCTQADEVEKMRNTLDKTFFLIPGYGAQGGKAEDVVRYMKNGNGGIVNSSRAILLAYKKSNLPFAEAAREEVLRMSKEILEARGQNGL